MPEPSRLVLLEQLPTVFSGTKIRLVGCVHSFHPSEARIIVRGTYPVATDAAPTAVVNIANILEDVNHDLLQVGSWVNVIGYVRNSSIDTVRRPRSSRDASKPKVASIPATINATMMWSAGAIKMDRYKFATREFQKLESAR